MTFSIDFSMMFGASDPQNSLNYLSNSIVFEKSTFRPTSASELEKEPKMSSKIIKQVIQKVVAEIIDFWIDI